MDRDEYTDESPGRAAVWSEVRPAAMYSCGDKRQVIRMFLPIWTTRSCTPERLRDEVDENAMFYCLWCVLRSDQCYVGESDSIVVCTAAC